MPPDADSALIMGLCCKQSRLAAMAPLVAELHPKQRKFLSARCSTMRLTTLTILAMMLLALSIPASADVGLNDWCTNLNGSISVCNFLSASSVNVNTSAFDKTLEGFRSTDPTTGPFPNGLGSITFMIGTGLQYASVYMDYDVDYSTLGSFDDAGSTSVTTPSATQSWELNDPNLYLASSNPSGLVLFDHFGNGSLPSTNSVDQTTCQANAPAACDVAWALAESLNVDSSLYSGGTVTFTVSTTKPTSGFYLQQTNQGDGVGGGGDIIYLSDTVNLTPVSSGPTVPEPSSVVLFGTLLAGARFLRKRSSAKAA
jgi:hypothetical protein